MTPCSFDRHFSFVNPLYFDTKEYPAVSQTIARKREIISLKHKNSDQEVKRYRRWEYQVSHAICGQPLSTYLLAQQQRIHNENIEKFLAIYQSASKTGVREIPMNQNEFVLNNKDPRASLDDEKATVKLRR